MSHWNIYLHNECKQKACKRGSQKQNRTLTKVAKVECNYRRICRLASKQRITRIFDRPVETRTKRFCLPGNSEIVANRSHYVENRRRHVRESEYPLNQRILRESFATCTEPYGRILVKGAKETESRTTTAGRGCIRFKRQMQTISKLFELWPACMSRVRQDRTLLIRYIMYGCMDGTYTTYLHSTNSHVYSSQACLLFLFFLCLHFYFRSSGFWGFSQVFLCWKCSYWSLFC